LHPGPSARALNYDACCQHLHAGNVANNAEQLMRSRYSAYVLGLMDYLRRSWDPATCPLELLHDPSVRWLGLRVLEHVQLDQTHAEVEFVARYKTGGAAATRLHERSRFVLSADGWLYVDGRMIQR
jgi:SEC-C motif-containing protein